MLSVTGETRIFAFQEAVDMRRGFTGLTSLVKHTLKEDPFTGALFVFHNRRGNYLKILFWDRTGFVLYSKRLERGKFRLSFTEKKQMISRQQLLFLLDGIAIGV